MNKTQGAQQIHPDMHKMAKKYAPRTLGESLAEVMGNFSRHFFAETVAVSRLHRCLTTDGEGGKGCGHFLQLDLFLRNGQRFTSEI